MKRNKLILAPGLSAEEMQAQAENFLSNYNGDDLENFDEDFDDEDMWTGYNDDLLSFQGGYGKSFLDEMKTQRGWTLKVQNTNATDEEVIILSGFDPESPNIITDGGSLSIAGNAVTCSGTPGSIRLFQKELAIMPTNILSFKVDGDSDLIRSCKLRIVEKSATLSNPIVTEIQFADYIGDQFQNKSIFVTRSFEASYKTQVSVVVPRNSITYYRFYVGARLDTHTALVKKNHKGRKAKMVGTMAAGAAKR